MTYSIIVTSYNSSDHITLNMSKLINLLNKINIKYEIIIIDDCSKDNSAIKIKKIIDSNKKIRIMMIKNLKNTGKSFSLKKGIAKSIYKKIILIDSDLPYFYKLKNIINSLKKFDLVMIDRRKKNSKNLDHTLTIYQFLRIIIGRMLNKIIRIFLPIKYLDTQAGLKGFIKPQNFSKLKFISKRFFFDLELILLFIKKKKSITTISSNFTVSNNSTINIFSLKKNYEIIKELIDVIKKNEKINN